MLLLLPTLLFSVALHLPAAPPATAVLSGHLDHAPAGDSVQLDYAGHYGRRRAAKAALSPTGDFRLTLPDVAKPVNVQFNYAGQRTHLHLRPGDDVHLALDFPKFDETLTYTGRGADANNYLARSLWKFDFGPAGDLPRPVTTATTTATQIRQQADAFRRARRDFLASYANGHPLSADFQRATALDIDLAWATALLDYPAQFRRLAKQEPGLSATYFEFLRQLPFPDIDAARKADCGYWATRPSCGC